MYLLIMLTTISTHSAVITQTSNFNFNFIAKSTWSLNSLRREEGVTVLTGRYLFKKRKQNKLI